MLTSEMGRVAEVWASEAISAAKASHEQSYHWGNNPFTNEGAGKHPSLRLFYSWAPPLPEDYKGALSSLAEHSGSSWFCGSGSALAAHSFS